VPLLFVACGGGDPVGDDTPSDVPTPVAIDTASLPDGTVGVAYRATLASLGGVGTPTWSVVAGALPEGLVLSGVTIEGVPTVAGTTTFTVEVRDDSGEARAELSILVLPADDVPDPLVITTPRLEAAAYDTPYTQTIEARGGTEAGYTWSIPAGRLPDGVQLESDGTPATMLVGTPTRGGSFSITIQVRDDAERTAERTYQLLVTGGELLIRPNQIDDLYVATPVAIAFEISGGTAGTYAWSVVDGALPAGLTASTTAEPFTLTGTPTTAGTFDFTLEARATNSSARRRYTGMIFEPLGIDLQGASGSCFVETPYLATLAATGGAPGPHTWTVVTGSLPPGLSLDGGGGVVSGTPTQAGTYPFAIEVEDTNGVTAQGTMTIEVRRALAIQTPSVPAASVGVPYTTAIEVVGGTAPYVFTIVDGGLPLGITLEPGGTPSLAALVGTAGSPGSYAFTLHVEDATGETDSALFDLVVVEPIQITTTSLDGRPACEPGIQTIETTGGVPNGPRSWSVVSGALPPGWVLADGQLYGRAGTPGTYAFRVRVVDLATMLSDERSYTVAVALGTQPPRSAVIVGALLDPSRNEVFEVDLCRTAGVPPSRVSPTGTSGSVRASALSPDGSKLAYVADFAVSGRNDLTFLFLDATPRSSATHLLGSIPSSSNTRPPLEWTADSRAVLTASSMPGARLYVSNVEDPTVSSTPVNIDPPGFNTGRQNLAPDGHGVLLETGSPSGDHIFYVDFMDFAAPPNVVALGAGGAFSLDPDWSDDARYALALGPSILNVIDVRASPPQRFVVHPDALRQGADFSPNLPHRLAFVVQAPSGDRAVHITTLTGSSFTPPVPLHAPLPAGQGSETARWNPQGTHVAFCAQIDRPGLYDLYIADMTQPLPATPVRVSNPSAGSDVECRDSRPAKSYLWSPDGSRIAFTQRDGVTGNDHAWVADLSGGPPFDLTQATPGAGAIPIAAFLDMRWTSDGARLVTWG
ncbi:MAG: putative Ig domain-containing protein, partial [Deltaproteobacteria bacterium]